MTSELQKKLRALREIAPELNAAADNANRVVDGVEEALKSMGLGISAVSDVFRTENEEICEDSGDILYRETDYRLAYGRVRGAYSIHILAESATGCQAGNLEHVGNEATQWAACDRETRMEAFPELPGLLDNLLAQAKKRLAAAKKAAEAVKDIIEDKGN